MVKAFVSSIEYRQRSTRPERPDRRKVIPPPQPRGAPRGAPSWPSSLGAFQPRARAAATSSDEHERLRRRLSAPVILAQRQRRPRTIPSNMDGAADHQPLSMLPPLTDPVVSTQRRSRLRLAPMSSSTFRLFEGTASPSGAATAPSAGHHITLHSPASTSASRAEVRCFHRHRPDWLAAARQRHGRRLEAALTTRRLDDPRRAQRIGHGGYGVNARALRPRRVVRRRQVIQVTHLGAPRATRRPERLRRRPHQSVNFHVPVPHPSAERPPARERHSGNGFAPTRAARAAQRRRARHAPGHVLRVNASRQRA